MPAEGKTQQRGDPEAGMGRWRERWELMAIGRKMGYLLV